MAISSDKRSATQLFLEQAVGCGDPRDFAKYSDQLESFQFSLGDESKFAACVESDIQGQFERHCLALMQGTADLEAGGRMWAIVKLYYALFYAVRAELHMSGLSIVRCRRIYLASGGQGSKPRKFSNKEKGDHGITFEVMRKKVGEYDILQTQSVDGENAYSWMRTLREVAQYKMRRPVEVTNFDPFFDFTAYSVEDQVALYLSDKDLLYCFDPDYAALAIAVTRFRLTLKKIRENGFALSEDFRAVAKGIAEKSKASNLIYSYMQP